MRMDTHDIFHARNIRSGVFVADYTRFIISGGCLARSVNWRCSSDVVIGTKPIRRFRPDAFICYEAF